MSSHQLINFLDLAGEMDKMKKSSIGRQKIPIKKIPKKSHLQVTFSKRRAGLFKKASELCTLCGVEVALVVFSPADKAFSFGHPNVESLVYRYLARNPTSPADYGPREHLVEAHRNANIRDLNIQLTQVLNQLEAEKKRGEALEHSRKASRSRCWWEAPAEELGLEELEQVRTAMEELRSNVGVQAKKLLLAESSVGGSNVGVGYGNSLFDTKPTNVSVGGSSVGVGCGYGLFW